MNEELNDDNFGSDIEELKKVILYYRDQSLKCDKLKEEAKTKTKQKYFEKRQIKNNKKLAKLLYLYDKIESKDKIHG